MFCQHCGKELLSTNPYCTNCGNSVQVKTGTTVLGQYDIPKCLRCSYVGPWKVGPVFRQIDWVLGIFLIFFWGSGLVYFLIVGASRSNPDNREKICPQCSSKNLWTFIY